MNFGDLMRHAMDNPDQAANPTELNAIWQQVQQLGSQAGGNPQAILSTLGSYVRSALKDQSRTQGVGAVEETVSRYSGDMPDSQAVDALFSPQEQDRVTRSLAQETGISPRMVQAMLPALVPMVLKFLQGGAPAQASAGTNPVLANFLDADRDGDVDIGDAFQLISRFIQMPR